MSSGPAQRARELRIFDAFLRAEPNFAGEVLSSPPTQPVPDPPDVVCETASGRRVGVELKGWVNEGQVSEAKAHEWRKRRVLAALGTQRNTTDHVAFVWLHLTRETLQPQHSSTLKAELLGLVADVDRDWPANGTWDSPQGVWFTDFQNHPALARYVGTVKIYPCFHFGRRENGWITFPLRGGAYSEVEMLDPLFDTISNAWEEYETTRREAALDELHLLIHYDDLAFTYCTPVEGPDFGFDEAAKQARGYVRDYELLGKLLETEDAPPFDRIFLFIVLQGEERAYRLR